MADISTLPVDTVVGGSRIIRVISVDASAITYEAEDLALQRRVAIREFYPSRIAHRDESRRVVPTSERDREVFQQELRAFAGRARDLARLRHPGIVHVISVIDAVTGTYVTTELVEGRTFEAWLASLHRPPSQGDGQSC